MSREMKDSGIRWIGRIPSNWVLKRVKQIISNDGEGVKIGPFGSALSNRILPDGEYNVYGQANLIENDFSKTKNTVSKETYVTLSSYKVIPGDICVSMMGTIGKCRIVPQGIRKGIMDSHLIKLRLNQKLIDNRFFEYVYDKDNSPICITQMQYDKKGTIMDGLNTTIVKNIVLPVPPLSEQHRIADFLDSKCSQIDEISKIIQEEIDTLEEYKKSVITEAVTKGLDPNVEMKDSGIEWIGMIPSHWSIRRIKTLGEYRNGLTYSPADMCDEGDGTLVLRSSNVQNGRISFKDNVYVKKSIPSSLMVKPGDILICSRNGSRELVGKNALIPEMTATFGAFMLIFRSEYNRFMYYVFNSNLFNHYLGTFFTTTINQLTGANFGNMRFPFCPNDIERKEIVYYLDEKCTNINEAISTKQQQLSTLEEYKKSLIYEYVTGKKEVPDADA